MHLQIYCMASVGFLLQNNWGRVSFLKKIFQWADISMEIVLRMPFLFLSDSDWEFGAKKLTWRSYIAAETLFIAKKVKLINKHKFALIHSSWTPLFAVRQYEHRLFMLTYLQNQLDEVDFSYFNWPCQICNKY